MKRNFNNTTATLFSNVVNKKTNKENNCGYYTRTFFIGDLTSNFCGKNARRYLCFGTTSYKSGRSEVEVSLKRYKYNGKERDEETGLYAYGMRYYAAWLCRFVSCDPLQHKYPNLSCFQYSSNNPITMIDLDGAEGVNPDDMQIQEIYQETTTPNEYIENGNTFRSVECSSQYGLHVTGNSVDLKYMSSSTTQKLYQFSAPTGTWDLVSTNVTNTEYLEINSANYSNSILEGLNVLNNAFSIGSLGSTIATTIGDLHGKLSVFEQGKFLANYKGVEKAWSLSWNTGNRYVDKSFVNAEKTKFLTNLKVLDKIGKVGKGLGVASAAISAAQISTTNSTLENIGHGADVVMSLVGAFGGTYGAVASAYYSGVIKNYPEIQKNVRQESVDRSDMIKNGFIPIGAPGRAFK